MMKCENCDGLGDDECLIQEKFPHLLYDKGKHDYGCKLHYRTYKWLYEYDCEASARIYGLIIGYDEKQGIISREPTQKELRFWKQQDSKFENIIKRLKECKENERN